MTQRIGIGYDIHRLVKGRPLWLGGIRVPSDKGLQGHSDADVLLHAITDAVLGAAALGDIGQYFPPSDPTLKGISSSRMLLKALEEAGKAGYRVVNIDAVVVAESPKIGPFRDQMRQKIAELLGLQVNDVMVKGKTNEGLDAVGKKQAIAAHAAVLLEKKDRVGATLVVARDQIQMGS